MLIILLQPTGGVILVNDTKPDESKTLLELKVKKAAPAPAPSVTGAGPAGGAAGRSLSDMVTDAYNAREGQSAAVDPAQANAADIAAVLGAVDEDDDGGEEADVPNEFDYESVDEDEDK